MELVHSDKRTKSINTLCVKNAEFYKNFFVISHSVPERTDMRLRMLRRKKSKAEEQRTTNRRR
jgi:hypothetical protein